MFKKELIICALATFFFLGLLGTAFAENRETSLIGSDQFSFDAPDSAINYEAARNYNYDQEHLALVGTEGGDSQFKFDAPVTKEQLAVKNHVYNQERLAAVGTEGGNWEFKFHNTESKSSETKATAGHMMEPKCTDC